MPQLTVIDGNREGLVDELRTAFQDGLLAPTGSKTPYLKKCEEIDERLSVKGTLKSVPQPEKGSSE